MSTKKAVTWIVAGVVFFTLCGLLVGNSISNGTGQSRTHDTGQEAGTVVTYSLTSNYEVEKRTVDNVSNTITREIVK